MSKKCKGFWRNVCSLEYNPNDLICIMCENLAKEHQKKWKKLIGEDSDKKT